jgi:hypothetical protein
MAEQVPATSFGGERSAAAVIGVIEAASQIYEIGGITVHQEGVKAQPK